MYEDKLVVSVNAGLFIQAATYEIMKFVKGAPDEDLSRLSQEFGVSQEELISHLIGHKLATALVICEPETGLKTFKDPIARFRAHQEILDAANRAGHDLKEQGNPDTIEFVPTATLAIEWQVPE